MQGCPYIEASFRILGKRWNGRILHYLYQCENYSSQFSDIKRDITGITARALSLRLQELSDEQLLEKMVRNTSPITIQYKLTEKGIALAKSLRSIQEWAQQYMNVELSNNKGVEQDDE